MAAPLLDNSGYFGGNQSLTRTRRLDANAALIRDRDTFTLTFDWLRTTIVGNSYGVPTSSLQALQINAAELRSLVQSGISPFLEQFLLVRFGQAYVDQLQTLVNFAHADNQTGNNLSGGLSWSHELTPTLSASAYGGYSRSRLAQTTLGTNSSAQVSVGVNDLLSGKLTARLNYTGSYTISGDQHAYNPSDNTITISLTRTF